MCRFTRRSSLTLSLDFVEFILSDFCHWLVENVCAAPGIPKSLKFFCLLVEEMKTEEDFV